MTEAEPPHTTGLFDDAHSPPGPAPAPEPAAPSGFNLFDDLPGEELRGAAASEAAGPPAAAPASAEPRPSGVGNWISIIATVSVLGSLWFWFFGPQPVAQLTPEMLAQAIDRNLEIKDGLVYIRDPLLGTDLSILPQTSIPWAVKCGETGLAVAFGPEQGDLSEPRIDISLDKLTPTECERLAPVLAKMVQDRLSH